LKYRTVDLHINSLSKKGAGIAPYESPDGQTNFVDVPFTMPGDKVSATLMKRRGNVYKAKLEEVLVPSPERIAPRCVHFATCGGCQMQEIPYADQIKYKEQLVLDAFKDLINTETEVHPFIPCDQVWHYRNKMEFSFSSDKAGKKYLGLIMSSTQGKVFNLTECHLSHPWFAEAVKCVRNWWHESGLEAYYMPRNSGSLRNLVLREGVRSGDRMVVLTVSGNPEFALQRHHLESFVAFVRSALEPTNPTCNLSIFLRIHQIGKGVPTNIYEMLLYGPEHIREMLYVKVEPHELRTYNFNVSPSAFFQPNPMQAERLYSVALSLAKVPYDNVVYDLYCGTGDLGICLAKNVKQVVGVEISPDAALDAQQNAKRNECTNVTVITGAVRHVLILIAERHLPPPDMVIINPPRAGLDPDSLDQVLQMNAPKILYVSCNPFTQAQNVAELVKHGYKLRALQSIDQLPHTYHIENIVVLEK
jgi:23S rRNA (uracil1939-C5)-methyltransferase